jgi:DNA processing protein
MRHTDLIYTLALLCAEGVGDITAKRLIEEFGSASNVFKAPSRLVDSFAGRGLASRLKSPLLFQRAEREMEFISRRKLSVWDYRDENYPTRLRHCPDAPVILFASGTADGSHPRIISIVGTRKITPHGVDFCQRLIAELAPLDPVVVSGLAYGTDITAHLAALDNRLHTIGVVAHGMDILYPAAHKKYVRAIEENGGLLTEFRSGTAPLPENFVRRNRIVAGLSEATIVIESAEKGGSLITAQMAGSYHREVFAVPGRPQDKLSEGCLSLIKSQQAHMLTSAADLVYHLNWEFNRPRPVQKQLFIELDTTEQTIYDYLVSQGRQLLDLIALDLKIAIPTVTSVLFSMELKGVVRPLPGKWFEAV